MPAPKPPKVKDLLRDTSQVEETEQQAAESQISRSLRTMRYLGFFVPASLTPAIIVEWLKAIAGGTFNVNDLPDDHRRFWDQYQALAQSMSGGKKAAPPAGVVTGTNYNQRGKSGGLKAAPLFRSR